MTATTEFVVPRSMPMTLLIKTLLVCRNGAIRPPAGARQEWRSNARAEASAASCAEILEKNGRDVPD
jgi:hypothetical protein